MIKRFCSIIGLAALMVLMTGILTAAAPMPVTTIELVGDGLPAVMNVGDMYTVTIHVTSDQPFNSAQAMPDLYYPGRGVVGLTGGDRAGQGTTATLHLTFMAKGSTAWMQDLPEHQGRAPVSIVVGVRYAGGYVAVQRFDFLVQVP